MTPFTDDSTATRLEKARRMLRSLADESDFRYFHSDGYPRQQKLMNDAAAALEVFNELAASPAWNDAPTCAGLWVLMDAFGNDQSYQVDDAEKWASEVEQGERWYGPIPADVKEGGAS